MSVRAYLITDVDVKIIDGKKYTHEDEEYIFNLWNDNEIWETFLNSDIIDCTNQDSIGFIEVEYDVWNKIKDNINNEEVVAKIDKAFNRFVDYIRINTY